MARWLRQSTSVDVPIGPFLDPTDGVTPETTLTITQPDIRLKKNGGAWAQKAAAQTLSHEENGFYEVTLDATDTNTLGLMRLAVFESGAAPVWEDFLVVPANVWDSYFSTDLLQVDATQWLGGAIASPTVTGVPEVDVTHFGGTAGTFASGRPEVNASHIAGGATSATILNRYWGSAVVTGTADSGTTTTMVDAARTEADADYWKGALLVFTSGNISGQAPRVTDFDPATDTFTFSPATTQAVSTQNYVLIPAFDIPAAVWDEPTSGHAVSATFGENAINTTTLVALIDTSAVGVATIDGDDPALAIRNAVGLASASLDTQLDALPTAAENAAAVLTTAMTESYAADGATMTVAQALYALQQYNNDRALAGVTMTVKKLDGTTTAYTLTVDDATNPTTVSRTA